MRTALIIAAILLGSVEKDLAARALCHRARTGNRATFYRQVLEKRCQGNLLLRGMRQRTVPIGRKVCERLWLAELF